MRTKFISLFIGALVIVSGSSLFAAQDVKAAEAANVETFRVKKVDCPSCLHAIRETVCTKDRETCDIHWANKADKNAKIGELRISPAKGEATVNKNEIKEALAKIHFEVE